MGYRIERYQPVEGSSDTNSSTGTGDSSGESTCSTRTSRDGGDSTLYSLAEKQRDLEVMLHYGYKPLEYPGQEFGKWSWLHRGAVRLSMCSLLNAADEIGI
jgi:hypothetical protein